MALNAQSRLVGNIAPFFVVCLEVESRHAVGDYINISGNEDEFGAILFN